MSEITLSVPDEALLALKTTPEQLGSELRIDIRPGRLFERDTQELRVASRAQKLQAAKAKETAA